MTTLHLWYGNLETRVHLLQWDMKANILLMVLTLVKRPANYFSESYSTPTVILNYFPSVSETIMFQISFD